LDLGDHAKWCSSEVQPHGLLQPGQRCVETSDDVIEEVFTSSATVCRALFYALRNPLGVLHESNRRFEFYKRRQLFIRSHNETLSVIAMRVCNPDRSPVGINR
jgi:hypothetical protein